LGYSPLKASVAVIPSSCGVILSSGVLAALLPGTGPEPEPEPLMLVGLAMAAIGLATFTTISDTTSWAGHVLPGELLMSSGFARTIYARWSAGDATRPGGRLSPVLLPRHLLGGSNFS
jgi:hypothetical protein